MSDIPINEMSYHNHTIDTINKAIYFREEDIKEIEQEIYMLKRIRRIMHTEFVNRCTKKPDNIG